MDAYITVTQFLSDRAAQRQVLDSYRTFGYAALDGLLSPDEVARLQVLWKSISDERKAAGKKPFATLLMPHASFPDIRNMAMQPELVKTIEHFLGGRIDLIQSQLMYGPPGNTGFSPHQDNFYNRAEPADGIITIWIALEDVDEVNGGVAVYPGSHGNGLIETKRDWLYLLKRTPYILKSLLHLLRPAAGRKVTDAGVIERFVYAMPATGSTPVVPALKAGAVMLMHGNLVHSSGANQTKERFRRSMLFAYIRSGTYYSSGKLAGRGIYDVYAQANA